MFYNSNEDKTESATPHKIKNFRKHSKTYFLHDLNSFFILLFFFLFLYVNRRLIFFSFTRLFIHSLDFDFNLIDTQKIFFIVFFPYLKNFFLFLSILFLGIFFILFLLPVFIYRKTFKIKFLMIVFNAFNIINNLTRKNFFNILSEFFGIMLKIIIFVYISFYFIWHNYRIIDHHFYGSLLHNLSLVFHLIIKYIFLIMVIIFFIAIINTGSQYSQYCNELKMTLREVKDEQKALEGNPLIKQNSRHLSRQLLKNFITSELIKSDVIIFHTMGYAIAIQYDIAIMSAPRVLAKGIGNIAVKMIKIAKKNNIPIFITDSLPAYLYYSFFVGYDIPNNLHQLIVKILAWAWNIKRWKKYGGIYPVMPIISFDNE